MTLFILLILIECLIIFLNGYVFRHDLMSPASISAVVFLVATLLAFYCQVIWEINLSGLTVMVIALGLLAMTVGESFGRHIKVVYHPREYSEDIEPVKPNPNTMAVLTVVVVTATLLYGVDAYRVGLMNGGSGLNAFAYMKDGYINGGSRMNPIIRQGFKLIMASSYISCFVFANNYLVLKQRLRDNAAYLIIIICSIVVPVFSGSRTEILRIVSALVLDFALIWRAYYRESNKRSTKYVLKEFVPLAVAAAVIAFLSRTLVKKTDVATSQVTSITYYVAFYVGSSIAVLNNKINMAFSGFDILSGSKVRIPEFVYLGNLDYGGNVGTVFQTKLLSMGLILMLTWIFIIYFVGGIIYERINYDIRVRPQQPLLLILFTSWYYIFTMSYYADIMSSTSFIRTNILTDMVLIIIYPLFFMSRIK